MACWPIYLAGTILAILRAEIPYIPTAKEARRGRFTVLAWPHLVVAAVYLATLGWTLYHRLAVVPEATLVLSGEAVWGMVAFASAALVLVVGGVRGAWEARRLPAGQPWERIEVDTLGGDGMDE